MSQKPQPWKARVDELIQSGIIDDVRKGYDEWAPNYDQDHVSFGSLLLVHFVGMFCRHVPRGVGPILDAGAGTGRMGASLSLHGYEEFIGIDLSERMLDVASKRLEYIDTHAMLLAIGSILKTINFRLQHLLEHLHLDMRELKLLMN